MPCVNAVYYLPITVLVKESIKKLCALVIKPFTKWKDAIERFNNHSKSEYHKLSIIRSKEFIEVMENKKNNIANEIDTSRRKQVIEIENRSILRPIIETLIACEKQNVKFVLLYFVNLPRNFILCMCLQRYTLYI